MIAFELAGVPVRIQPVFFLTMALLGWTWPGGLLVFAAIAFFGVLLHEFGHVAAYRLFGHEVEVEFVALGGLTRSLGGPTLKAWQHAIVSLAGPAAGFAAALAVYIPMLLLTPSGLSVSGALASFVGGFVMVNVVWSVFNLLPVRPLDGGQALFAVLAMLVPRWADPATRVLSVLLAGAGLALALAFGEIWLALLAGLSVASNAQPLWMTVQVSRHRDALEGLQAGLAKEDWVAVWEHARDLPRTVVGDALPAALSDKLYAMGEIRRSRDAATLAHRWTGKPLLAYNVACCEARLGRTEVAMDWLVKAIEGGFDDVDLLDDDEDLAPLRQHPFWPELRAAVAETAEDPWRPPNA